MAEIAATFAVALAMTLCAAIPDSVTRVYGHYAVKVKANGQCEMQTETHGDRRSSAAGLSLGQDHPNQGGVILWLRDHRISEDTVLLEAGESLFLTLHRIGKEVYSSLTPFETADVIASLKKTPRLALSSGSVKIPFDPIGLEAALDELSACLRVQQ